MTAQEIIQAALRLCGIGAAGETVATEDLTVGLEALQVMLRSWAASGLNIFANVLESKALTVAQASYTWGSGGNIATARPHRFLNAYIQDSSGVDHPIISISEPEYQNLTLKTTPGRPYWAYYKPDYPLGILYLYPVEDQVETIYLNTIKPWTETSSFDALGSTLSFPANYQRAIKYNLAIELAPEFGKSSTPETVKIAEDALSKLRSLNAANKVRPVRIDLFAARRSGNIFNMGN